MIQQLESQPNCFCAASISSFQKHYDLINQTCKLIKQQENREKEYKLQKKDPFLSFALSILKQNNLFPQFAIFGPEFREEIRQIQILTNSFITLNRVINENFDFCNKKSQCNLDFIQVIPPKQNYNIIIIELDLHEVPQIIEFKNPQLNQQDYIDLLYKKSKENLEFWDSQERLWLIYQKEISNLIYEIKQNQTLVYVVRQKLKHEDIKSHFSEYFIIKYEELCLDYKNNGTETYVPYIIFNQLFEDSVINPIVELSKLNKQADFFEIQQCLGDTIIKPIYAYNKLIKIAKNCWKIIRWVNLLQKYLLQFQQIDRVKQEEDKCQEIKHYLFECYKNYDKRYIDEFYDVKKERSFDIFLNFDDIRDQDYLCKYYFSIILYQIKKDCLLLYQKYRIGYERMNMLAKLEFPTYVTHDDTFQKKFNHNNEYEDNQIDLDQLSLVDMENGQIVYKFKFKLKEENKYLLQSQNTKYKDLIMEIIMKSIAIKVKQVIFNPMGRKYQNTIQQIIEI